MCTAMPAMSSPRYLDLSGVDAYPYFDAKQSHRIDDRGCALDGRTGAGEHRDEAGPRPC